MTSNKMRIAIVGAGPAGLYSASHLLDNRSTAVEIDFIERLPNPWGLVRAGVAPDHGDKKQITDRLFDFYLRDPRVQFFGNVEVGKDVRVDELAEWYDAVIYAQGAGGHNTLGIPGETLSGIWGARDFVQFYNAHPDQSQLKFDLSHPRVVIIGNGNVAVDVARILTADIAALEKTDISDQALDLLKTSEVREVVIMARRDLEFAAFNNPELEEFEHANSVDIYSREPVAPPISHSAPLEKWKAQRRHEIFLRLLARTKSDHNKRIVFHFLATPLAFRGDGRVEQVDYLTNTIMRTETETRYKPSSDFDSIEAGLVLTACGYRGTPLTGLPFDAHVGVVPNISGRVLDAETKQAGVYVTGWIKRGCRGIIGSNRRCAHETVSSLLSDQAAGLLVPGLLSREEVTSILANRVPRLVLFDNWHAIDRAERLIGRSSGRPRVKFSNVDDLLEAAFSTASPPDQNKIRCANGGS